MIHLLKGPAEEPFKLFRYLFLGFVAISLILLPIMALDTGINADEFWQKSQSETIDNFYATFGKDRSVMADSTYFRDGEAMKYYGGFYELISSVTNNIVGNEDAMVIGYHTVRHILLALFGVVCIFFTGLIAKELMNWRAAFIAALLLFISPRFLGHTMMNPKDIPFAMGYVVAAYFIIKFFRYLPKPGWGAIMGVAAGIGIALGSRAGGLLVLAYLGLFTLAALAYFNYIKKAGGFSGKDNMETVKRAFFAGIIGYAIGVFFWPYALLNPISHPIEALGAITHFQTEIPQLFEGQQIISSNLPWYYLPKYLVISNPLVVLLGVASFVALAFLYMKTGRLQLGQTSIILFMVIFPIAYIIFKKSNVYNGWRHILFVYPPLVALAGLGWEFLLQRVHAKAGKYAIAGLATVLAFLPVKYVVANHPYEYVYFNELVGGTKNAYKEYITDYWMISVREAAEKLADAKDLRGTDKQITIGTNCYYPSLVYFKSLSPNITVKYVRYYQRSEMDWDYGVFYNDYVSPYQLQKGVYPPDNLIYLVQADGAPLCAVVDRTNKSDLLGYEALNRRDYNAAIANFESAAKIYTKNESVFSGLGLTYLSTNEIDKAIAALGRSLQLYPENAVTNYYLGAAYAQKGNMEYAKFYLDAALKLNPNFQQARDLRSKISQ